MVDGYIWRYANKNGVSALFRGIRNWEKDGQEERQLQILNIWGPILLGPFVWPIPSLYLEGIPEYNHVSSTLIREICEISGASSNSTSREDALSKLVPAEATEEVAKLYGN